MAYLKLGCIKQRKTGSPSEGLYRCLEYIYNKKKTESKYIGGHNIYIDNLSPAALAYEQMMDTKKQFGKLYGRQGYHYKLSFPPGEVTALVAYMITKEFVSRYLADYEVAYSVHTDKKHMHSHIVFNSIDMKEGYKYHYKKGDWAKNIQPIINEICNKYGLSGIDLNLDDDFRLSHRSKSYKKWLEEHPEERKSNAYTNAMILRDIRECISAATSYNDFKELLKSKGHIYDDNPKHKYITIKAPGRTNACRIVNLTPDKQTYTKENIVKMIAGTYNRQRSKEFYERLIADIRFFFIGNYTKLNDIQSFAERKGLNTRDDINSYMSYLDTSLEVLTSLKRQVILKYNAASDAIEDLDKLLQLYKFHKMYKSGKEKFKEESDEVVSIYASLKERGYNIVKLKQFSIKAKKCIAGIEEYNKHIFIEKKICERIKNKKDIKKEKKLC